VCLYSAGKDWIFDLLSAYQPTERDVSVKDLSLLQQCIEANFTAASHLYASDVGGLDWVEALNTDVAFFLLNDATDRDGVARSRLPGGPQIHSCGIDTVHFTQTHFRQRQSSTAGGRDHEFRNLCSFLDGVSYGPMYEFPAEQMLCVDSITSVTDRLRRHLMMSSSGVSGSIADSRSSKFVNSKSESVSIVVFVRRTSPSLVDHSQLLHRVFKFAQSKLLMTQQCSVYIVTDVGCEVALPQIPDGLLEPSSKDIEIAVYSGAKAMFSPITCIVIALKYSST